MERERERKREFLNMEGPYQEALLSSYQSQRGLNVHFSRGIFNPSLGLELVDIPAYNDFLHLKQASYAIGMPGRKEKEERKKKGNCWDG